MGVLVDGVWQDTWYDTTEHGGRFVRPATRFRNWITADGGAGPSGDGGFKAEPDRYHLYVSLACPWAHRTLILRKLKRLTDVLGVSVVHPHMLSQGWEFTAEWPDDLYGSRRLYEIYLKAERTYSGRVSVPVLWDRQRETIVSNESADIIRMLNEAFNAFGDASLDFYPETLRAEIDALNAVVYDAITTASTRPASPPRRRPMRRRSGRCSIRWMSLTSASTPSGFSWVTR